MKKGDLICFTLSIGKPGPKSVEKVKKLLGIVISIDEFTATVLHNGRTHYWPVGNCEKVYESDTAG